MSHECGTGDLVEQIAWMTARCNAAMGEGFSGTPSSAVAAVCDTLEIQRELIAEWRKTLVWIADAQSGIWGRKAREALDREVLS